MTSATTLTLSVRIERWPIAGSFTISRGAKFEAVTVVAEIGQDGLVGRGECVPYPRYGETPDGAAAALFTYLPHVTEDWVREEVLLALAGNVAAQEATQPTPAKAKNLSTVIVTGTRADNRTESSSLTPIDVVSAKVLQQTGTSELSTALARIIPSLTFPRPSAADTADSPELLAYRGPGPASTPLQLTLRSRPFQ